MIRPIRDPAKKIAFISSSLPKQCGIATFTSDLINNLALAAGSQFESKVFAMDSGDDLEYGEMVKFQVRKDIESDYTLAAEHINSADIDIVSLQHEFGLFGGKAGSHINILLDKLTKPVVTTLHTVLEKPSSDYFDSMVNVCDASAKLIVMNERGVEMLQSIYDVPKTKIKLIPHGIPDLPFTDNGHYKRKLGIAGRKTILTFGLLSENKGIEVMLKAMPKIVKAHPAVLYIVLGTTHPEVLRRHGPAYRLKLKKIVKDLGLQRNVVFHHRFVQDDELLQFLGAADIYVTPYLYKEQLTSGTLAFAVGTGKAVVSTPYWAAQELLADGRGRLVRFGDSQDIARSVVEIFDNDTIFHNMKKRAYEYGRSRIWPRVGQTYWDLFKEQETLSPTPVRLRDRLPNWKVPFLGHRPVYLPT